MNNYTKNLAANCDTDGAIKYLKNSKNIFVLEERLAAIEKSAEWAHNEKNVHNFFNDIDFSDLPFWGKPPAGTTEVFSWDRKAGVFLNADFSIEKIKDSFCEDRFKLSTEGGKK